MTIRELDNLFKSKLGDHFHDYFYESYMNFSIFPGDFESVQVDISDFRKHCELYISEELDECKRVKDRTIRLLKTLERKKKFKDLNNGKREIL